jgi:hypothetical protein
MRKGDRLRATLVGGPHGPSGWALSNGSGRGSVVTLEALLCLEHKLRSAGDLNAADDLYRQVTTLARVAEAWQQPDPARHRPLGKTAL